MSNFVPSQVERHDKPKVDYDFGEGGLAIFAKRNENLKSKLAAKGFSPASEEVVVVRRSMNKATPPMPLHAPDAAFIEQLQQRQQEFGQTQSQQNQMPLTPKPITIAQRTPQMSRAQENLPQQQLNQVSPHQAFSQMDVHQPQLPTFSMLQAHSVPISAHQSHSSPMNTQQQISQMMRQHSQQPEPQEQQQISYMMMRQNSQQSEHHEQQQQIANVKLENLETRFGLFESEMEKHFKVLSSTVAQAVAGIQVDIAGLKVNREEFLARDQRMTESVVEKVTKKSMHQLNNILAEGLHDFFEKVKSEIDEMDNSVQNSVCSVREMYGQVNEQINQLSLKMEVFQKQLEKNEAEQQLLLHRFKQTQQLSQSQLPHNFPQPQHRK